MRVFVIDEDDLIRLRFVNELSEICGIEVATSAADNEAVVLEISELLPDIVIIGMQLQGRALGLIRSIKSVPHPPVVIAISYNSSTQYRTACHYAGADFFFDKVREQERLWDAIVQMQNERSGPSNEWPTGE